MELLATGMPNKEIARKLFISEATERRISGRPDCKPKNAVSAGEAPRLCPTVPDRSGNVYPQWG